MLILAKAAGCSWSTTKAMLIMHSAGRGLSVQDLESAATRFERLTRETARQVVKFYERRGKLAAAKAPPAQEAEQPPAIVAGLASAEALECQ